MGVKPGAKWLLPNVNRNPAVLSPLGRSSIVKTLAINKLDTLARAITTCPVHIRSDKYPWDLLQVIEKRYHISAREVWYHIFNGLPEEERVIEFKALTAPPKGLLSNVAQVPGSKSVPSKTGRPEIIFKADPETSQLDAENPENRMTGNSMAESSGEAGEVEYNGE